jgi:hypothetical protein
MLKRSSKYIVIICFGGGRVSVKESVSVPLVPEAVREEVPFCEMQAASTRREPQNKIFNALTEIIL